MTIQLQNIELKHKGFLIQYNPTNLEFIPFSEVKMVRLNTQQYQNNYDIQILLCIDGVRVIQCKNEEQAKEAFHNFVNHYNKCV